jgi:MFS family permease
MASIALVLHVQENLGLGPRAFGLILAAGALGGVLGGFLAERIVAKLGARRSAQWMLAACAPGFLAMGLAPGAWALGAAFAVFEFIGIVWNTVSVTTRQRTIPDRLLGRVNSLYRLLAFGTMPVGLVGSGLIVRAAEQVAARETALVAPFVVAALGTAILTAVGWRALARGFRAAGG